MQSKKIVLGLLVLATLSNAKGLINLSNEQLLQAYELGHYHGINQLEREFMQEGVEKIKVDFKKYMVVLEISNLPIHKIFLLKNYGYLEGVTPITLTNNKLVFKSFNRKADAEYLANVLNQNYKLEKSINKTATVIENDINETYYKAPFIYKGILENMLEKVKSKVKGKVFIVDKAELEKQEEAQKSVKQDLFIEPKQDKEIEEPEKVVEAPKKEEKKVIKKEIKPMYFSSKYNIKALTYMGDFYGYNSKKWEDKDFVEMGMTMTPEQKYRYQNIITTKDGTRIVKVYNKNIWLNVEDTNIEDKGN
jgi:hypothetical protein